MRDFCDWRTNSAYNRERDGQVFIGTGCPRPWVYNITFTQGLFYMPFDFHSRYGLFTYSQCDGLDAHDVVCHFASLGAECIIGRENHADGGTHFHVFADFGRKRRFRRPVFADVGLYHPNIKPSRGTPGAAYDYAIKDGDVVGGAGLPRPADTRADGRGGAGGADNTMGILVGIDDEHTFWRSVQEMAPGLLLRNHPSLVSYAKWRFAPRVQEYCHPRELAFRDERISALLAWREDNLSGTSVSGGGRYVSPLLGAQGPTGSFR